MNSDESNIATTTHVFRAAHTAGVRPAQGPPPPTTRARARKDQALRELAAQVRDSEEVWGVGDGGSDLHMDSLECLESADGQYESDELAEHKCAATECSNQRWEPVPGQWYKYCSKACAHRKGSLHDPLQASGASLLHRGQSLSRVSSKVESPRATQAVLDVFESSPLGPLLQECAASPSWQQWGCSDGLVPEPMRGDGGGHDKRDSDLQVRGATEVDGDQGEWIEPSTRDYIQWRKEASAEELSRLRQRGEEQGQGPVGEQEPPGENRDNPGWMDQIMQRLGGVYIGMTIAYGVGQYVV